MDGAPCFLANAANTADSANAAALPQQVFERSAKVGFFVAVLYDHGRVDAEAPLLAFAFVDGARAGHYYCRLGDDQRAIDCGAQHFAAHEIVDGCAAREDGAGGEDRAFADDGCFVDSTVAADENVVFNNDGAGVDRLEHASDLCSGTQVHMLADLRAGTDEGMRVDHCAFVDIGSGVDVHGRHADDTAR